MTVGPVAFEEAMSRGGLTGAKMAVIYTTVGASLQEFACVTLP